MQPRNARFWVFVNGGPVKLTLRPDQRFSWGQAWRTDEGWSSEGATWEHNGDHVLCEWVTDGKDCDGQLTHYSKSTASLDRLRWNMPYHGDSERAVYEGVMWPDWQKVSASQRDQYAEAAGY